MPRKAKRKIDTERVLPSWLIDGLNRGEPLYCTEGAYIWLANHLFAAHPVQPFSRIEVREFTVNLVQPCSCGQCNGAPFMYVGLSGLARFYPDLTL